MLIFVSTGFVLLMQLGFAFLENGAIRKKNSYQQNFMNVVSTALEVIVWWLWGFGLAYGFTKRMILALQAVILQLMQLLTLEVYKQISTLSGFSNSHFVVLQLPLFQEASVNGQH